MRRAQGAIEYLFMIAAALIIILVVVRYLSRSGIEQGTRIEQTAGAINETLNELNRSTAG
ncbi:class III signal peptide-containing protein [Pyrococcus yayanosii]|uniref:Class III signal peptide n=1 Tax=Pyrococcus yayanosii (strain CH1 / JCM 16557) TaxID=529709 RepID=F8AHQ6_PYRYC|nr:class III signal peptide-containing protein [Pyrococcus yayanosii]AEH24189.1 hypothetical protein PYCH_04990 [Pyrococcus yayanosii CH1]